MHPYLISFDSRMQKAITPFSSTIFKNWYKKEVKKFEFYKTEFIKYKPLYLGKRQKDPTTPKGCA